MTCDQPEDAVLVGRVVAGDAAAFEALVRRHARAAFAVARAIVVSHDDAEDICQDAWLRALEKMDECREPSRFVFWLLQIVRNHARNHMASRRLRATEPLDDGGEARAGFRAPDCERESAVAGWRHQLERTLPLLGETQREVLLLHEIGGWKHREIAASLGISEVMCRQHLFQARARMRRLLGGAPGARLPEEQA